MISATKEFLAPGSQARVWELVNDPKAMGECIPGCEEVAVIGADESRWKMKMSVGVISKRIDAKAKVIRRVSPENLEISVESSDGDLKAQFILTLHPAGAGDSTLISFTANIDARGPFQWVVNQVIKSQLDGFVRSFSECFSKKILDQGE